MFLWGIGKIIMGESFVLTIWRFLSMEVRFLHTVCHILLVLLPSITLPVKGAIKPFYIEESYFNQHGESKVLGVDRKPS